MASIFERIVIDVFNLLKMIVETCGQNDQQLGLKQFDKKIQIEITKVRMRFNFLEFLRENALK